ncbi:integrase arm-type DNA-binding domain-containing protein [Pelagerythrobacter marensis]|uniref:Integrase arm-type DNA-binding domain-containing protein n=1 Tax=Pelagerythrobacter marensis TaxID=543877 RepID=A0ABZ2D2D9_9SPHN
MLTNAAAKAAGAQSRAYKLFDGGGLFLHVAPTGTKGWRLKYRWRGREKLLVLGRFPAMNLAKARMAREEAKAKLRDGVDPAAAGARLDTFDQVARAWHAIHRARWSAVHAGDVLASLERDVFPAIGARAIDAIGAAELVQLLEAIEASGRIETAKRLRQRLRQIFAFAKTRELVGDNPASELGAALAGVAVSTPHPALTDIAECRALLAACEAVPARPITRLASRFLALTAVRLEAVRGLRWSEIDWEARIWTVPAVRMKLAKAKKGEQRFDHIVPLAPAAIDVLREAAAENGYDTRSLVVDPKFIGGSPHVFPGRTPGTPIGEGALRELYIRAGYAGRHVPHGWRSSFSTILNEQLGEEWSGAIDRALAHAAMGKVEAAYNRAQMLDRRRQLFERWGALLAS